MRIALTIPDSLYAKLEKDRGAVPRATYIQLLIGQGLVGEGVVGAESEKRVKGGGLPVQEVGSHTTYFKS